MSDRAKTDHGLTLVELLVTMSLMLVVGAITLTAVINSHTTLRHTDDEAQGLADVRTVIERLGRDIRTARGVEPGGAPNNYPAATASQLSLWIDSNSNYRKESSEVVTWKLVARSGSTQYDVVRQPYGGAEKVVARTLVDALAFSYDAAVPADSRVVSVRLEYDAVTTGATSRRVTTFSDRLRNVS